MASGKTQVPISLDKSAMAIGKTQSFNPKSLSVPDVGGGGGGNDKASVFKHLKHVGFTWLQKFATVPQNVLLHITYLRSETMLPLKNPQHIW